LTGNKFSCRGPVQGGGWGESRGKAIVHICATSECCLREDKRGLGGLSCRVSELFVTQLKDAFGVFNAGNPTPGSFLVWSGHKTFLG